MDLQPFANAIDLLELGEEGQPKLRLLDDTDKKLEHCFVIVNIFLVVEGVHKIVEQINEAEEGLSCHCDIAVLCHIHEDREQYIQQDGVTAAPANHFHKLQAK